MADKVSYGVIMKRMHGDINYIVEEAYRDGYDSCEKEMKEQVEEAYQKGLYDGKAQDSHGCEGCEWDGTPFDVCSKCRNSYENLYKQKESDDEIKVGDIVTIKCSDKHTFIVTKVSDESVWGVDANGSWNYWAINEVTKTDKHFDIDKILEAMKK